MSAADDIAAVRRSFDARCDEFCPLCPTCLQHAALDRLAALLAATEADAKKAWEFERKMLLRATASEAREKALREALQETYEIIRSGDPNGALHALDAFLITHGIHPDFAAASSPEGER